MKKTVKATVEVPVTTLSAIKNMLFNSNGGVDLSKIINDLGYGEAEDMTAINVGLTFKGIMPNIDKTTRYDSGYRQISKYEFVGVSLIRENIKVHEYGLRFSQKDNAFDENWEDMGERTFSLSDWLNMSTNEVEQREYVVKQYGKKEETYE